MNFAVWAQAHRRSILFLVVMLVIAGLMAAFRLPVTLFPNVDFPRVSVAIDSGDRPAEQMEIQVTNLAEEALRLARGVESVRSTTSRGSAEMSVNFGWGIDMAMAASQVDQAISGILPQLPPGTTFSVRRMDPTVFPMLAYSLTSDHTSLTKLYDVAQYQLRPLLSGISGIARVTVSGGAQEEIQVIVQPSRLAAYGLTMADVSKALAASNVVAAVGRLEDHYKLYLGVTDTQLKELKDIRQVVVRTGDRPIVSAPTTAAVTSAAPGLVSGLVRLQDVATVELSTVPQWIRVNANGHDAVLLQVYQQPGGNSVQIQKDVTEKLAAYRTQLPQDIQIANWYDQSRLVVDSASSVRDAILIGVVLAGLVLFVFLRNVKVMLIAVIIVPAVLAATVILLTVAHMSFNIMTLGGMAAAVGLIIDDAIVMVEHIVRRLEHAQGSEMLMHNRVLAAAQEFVRPLVGSSASTIVIFIPLAFLDGVTGAFFKALSITMAASLVISFLMTWLAVPILADRLLGAKDYGQSREDGRVTVWLHERYGRLMGRVLGQPLLLLLGLLPLLLVGVLAYNKVGSGFMPSMDEGGFVLDYVSPPGTSLTETDRLLQQVERIVRENPNVDTYSRRTGTQLGGGLTESNEGDFFIRLKPFPRDPIEDVMDQIRGDVEKQVPGLEIELAKLMEDVIGDLTATPQPIEIKIFSNDPKQLEELAGTTAEKIGKINGVVDVKDGIKPAGDALSIDVDRVKAAIEGVDPDSVSLLVSNALTGQVATQIRQGIKMVGVRVWIPAALRHKQTDLEQLLLEAPDGHLFPLNRVARLTAITGQPQLSHDNFRRMVAVTARISGSDIGTVITGVKQVMDAPGFLPKGVYYELGGLYQQQQIAFKGLLVVFAAALGLVFLLLLFMYESFRVAISVLTLPLLSVAAVFVGLWVTGLELNISAMMGMTMIVGIITEVAIFFFSEFAEVTTGHGEENGSVAVALIQAGKNRMRPIAMTTIAAILTLLPLAFAIGQGSEMQQPLAVAIISGLIIQLPLVLIVMPVLYHLMNVRRNKVP